MAEKMDRGSTSATENISPPMHDAYYRARKLYIFFSLLLFGHELIGLVGIDIKEILKNLAKIGSGDFKNPGALVVGYFFLWVYSAVHFGIEWRQVAQDRRKVVPSKWDFWLTHSIAITAVTLWGTQRISGFQVAKEPLPFLLPFLVGLIVPLIFNFWKRSTLDEFDENQKKGYYITFIVLSITAPVLTVGYFLFFIDNLSLITILSLVGAFIIGMIKNALDGMPPFPSSSTPTPGDPSAPSISPVSTETTDENNKPEARSTKSETHSKSEGPKQKKTPDRKTSKPKVVKPKKAAVRETA